MAIRITELAVVRVCGKFDQSPVPRADNQLNVSATPSNPAPLSLGRNTRPDAVPGLTRHAASVRLKRALWSAVWLLLFRPSPRVFHAWRRSLLRLFGARLHTTARVYPSVRVWAPWNLTMGANSCIGDDVDCYCVAPITIGARSTVSQYSFLCAASHDFEDPAQPLTTAPITIGENVWLAADVFVAPGVSIPDGVVVGARSSVFTSDLPPWHLCAGNPAKAVRKREFKRAPGASPG